MKPILNYEDFCREFDEFIASEMVMMSEALKRKDWAKIISSSGTLFSKIIVTSYTLNAVNLPEEAMPPEDSYVKGIFESTQIFCSKEMEIGMKLVRALKALAKNIDIRKPAPKDPELNEGKLPIVDISKMVN